MGGWHVQKPRTEIGKQPASLFLCRVLLGEAHIFAGQDERLGADVEDATRLACSGPHNDGGGSGGKGKDGTRTMKTVTHDVKNYVERPEAEGEGSNKFA